MIGFSIYYELILILWMCKSDLVITTDDYEGILVNFLFC